MEAKIDSHFRVSRHGISAFPVFSSRAWKRCSSNQSCLFARDGKITADTVLGKFFCTAATLA